jgi:hypothetical protein
MLDFIVTLTKSHDAPKDQQGDKKRAMASEQDACRGE